LKEIFYFDNTSWLNWLKYLRPETRPGAEEREIQNGAYGKERK
jgi:hypothetical protein